VAPRPRARGVEVVNGLELAEGPPSGAACARVEPLRAAELRER
jgi:hypothetical protein